MTTHDVAAGAGGFFPAGFEPPKSGGNYFKPQLGENRIRIVSKPIMGQLGWSRADGNNTPLRASVEDHDGCQEILDKIKNNEKPKDRQTKFFVAMVVYDFDSESLKVWEITQGTIIDAIHALNSDLEWGDMSDLKTGYGLKVTKTGSGLDTKYAVLPGQKVAATPAMTDGIDKIDLNALFKGNNPFESVDKESGGTDWVEAPVSKSERAAADAAQGAGDDDEDGSEIPF